jgi:hypothetical protein
MPSASQWSEWKRRCALGRCDPETRRALRQFAHQRFRRYAARGAPAVSAAQRPLAAAALEPDAAWHLWETHAVTGTGRGGRRYKDWLFARAASAGDAPVDVIEAGGALLMRDVVREWLRREFSPAMMTSLDAPLPGSEGPVTLGDLLPGTADPLDDISRREVDALAARVADETLAGMTRRERVALLAKFLGLSLAHPAVEEAGGCRKTVLNEACVRMMDALGARIRRTFAAEDPACLPALGAAALRRLRERLESEEKAEKRCARLFMVMEGHDVAAGDTRRSRA